MDARNLNTVKYVVRVRDQECVRWVTRSRDLKYIYAATMVWNGH